MSSIVTLESKISIFNLGTFEFEDKCLTIQLKLSQQGMTSTGMSGLNTELTQLTGGGASLHIMETFACCI